MLNTLVTTPSISKYIATLMTYLKKLRHNFHKQDKKKRNARSIRYFYWKCIGYIDFLLCSVDDT